MSKFTPGTWTVKDYLVAANADEPRTFKIICYTANNPASRNPENAANAHLISAAKDLLAACEAARSYINSDDMTLEARDAAIDALNYSIAKAEGDA